jgi:bacterioferritin-associated ferredoxin
LGLGHAPQRPTAVNEDPTPVRRCVCFDTTFAELLEAGVKSVEEAAERFGCGTKCGTCRPYIQLMVETGQSAFAVLPMD